MYHIRFVGSRDSDQPIVTDISGMPGIDAALTRARILARSSKVAAEGKHPWHPNPVGFLIYDASGRSLLHREYLL